MIKRPTVLVLGAGASWPFGYPTGLELKDRITEDIMTTPGNIPVLTNLGHSREVLNWFREGLLRSGRTSVDVFLATRPDFMDVGKAAIALALLPIEQSDQLFAVWPRVRRREIRGEPDHKGQPNAMRANGNWYELLFNAMVDDDLRLEAAPENKVSIVTFNYDRSLEHYLMTALMNTYGKSESVVAEVLNRINIVHVHGSLGKLPWQPGDAALTVAYATQTGPDQIKVAASCIKVLPEGQRDSDEFKRAQDLIQKADRVHFLGFGFNRTNIDRLGLLALPQKPGGLGATRRGLSYETRLMLYSAKYFSHAFRDYKTEPDKQEDVYSYLHSHVTLCD